MRDLIDSTSSILSNTEACLYAFYCAAMAVNSVNIKGFVLTQDLQADNFTIKKNGQVKLIDFKNCNRATDNDDELDIEVLAGDLDGSRYAAPEVRVGSSST